MDWMDTAQARLRRKNQVLFRPGDELLQPLARELESANHRAAALWAWELAEQMAAELARRHPEDPRPAAALAESRRWGAGLCTMRPAQRAILDCHACAKEWNSPVERALCHGVGQACSVVHTAGHALGGPVYQLTALALELGFPGCREAVERRAAWYRERLAYWKQWEPGADLAWADFMKR